MSAFRDLRRNGAAAIDMCHVAEGVLDAYFERDIKNTTELPQPSSPKKPERQSLARRL